MTAVEGTYKDGKIVLDAPTDWPSGCRVRIEPIAVADDDGGTGDEQRDDPESLARWLAEFDAVPPLDMTPDEETTWRAAREAQNAYEKSHFEERAKQIAERFS
jgi:hypothetical protein